MIVVTLKTIAVFVFGFALCWTWAWISIQKLRVPLWLGLVGAVSCGFLLALVGPYLLIWWIG